jgi:hypothetical protein
MIALIYSLSARLDYGDVPLHSWATLGSAPQILYGALLSAHPLWPGLGAPSL